LCEVPDEPALRSACALLDGHQIRFARYHEPDRGNELTALATEPLRGRRRRAPLRPFPLFNHDSDDGCADSARSDSQPHFPKGSVMSSDSLISRSIFPTGFGMFAPCDRQTYRKLKRIRHLAGFAEVERRRWDRSQPRLPHNRTFKRRRASGKIVREPVDENRMIFKPFFELRPVEPTSVYPVDARLAGPTDLHARFFEDYRAARHPKATAAEVRPLSLSRQKIDSLLEQIELWNLRR
jgi:hypothetical protein